MTDASSTLTGAPSSTWYLAAISTTTTTTGATTTETNTYKYDLRNRLFQFYRNGSLTAGYGYDNDGNIIAETDYRAVPITTAAFLVDTMNPTGYSQILERWDVAALKQAGEDEVPGRTNILGNAVIRQVQAPTFGSQAPKF